MALNTKQLVYKFIRENAFQIHESIQNEDGKTIDDMAINLKGILAKIYYNPNSQYQKSTHVDMVETPLKDQLIIQYKSYDAICQITPVKWLKNKKL